MENAGRNMAEWLLAQRPNGPAVICCGRGNNGGDGFVIARHLDNAGVAVRVLLFAPPQDVAGDAAGNWRRPAPTRAAGVGPPRPDQAALRGAASRAASGAGA